MNLKRKEKFISFIFVKVKVEINKIEKFVEYKIHIEIFEYKGTERREFLNTKETLDYLFDDFPN